MSIDYMFFDFREEHHTSIFRIWAIAEAMDRNTKGKNILTLSKAQLIDLIVKNPSLFRRTCELVSGKRTAKSIGDILYSTHVDRSHRARQKDFLTKVLILQAAGAIELVRDQTEYFLKCVQPLPVSDHESVVHLKSQLIAIKSVLGKSDAVIEKMILGVE